MARGRASNKKARSGVVRKREARNDVPDVYREMLADTVTPSTIEGEELDRAVKRRRVGGRIITQANQGSDSHQSAHSDGEADDSDIDYLFEDVKPNPQHVLQTASENSADSDMDWEEVQFKDQVQEEDTSEPENADNEGLNLVLQDSSNDQKSRISVRAKRKPMTAEDKKLRLEVHQMHLCCLLAHIYIRNHWCNDEKVYAIIRRLLPKKTISYLNPDEDQSQFQRSRSFIDGLTQASEAFRGNFKVSARGMGKSRWADGPETLALLQPPDDIDLPMQITDFCDAARELSGSRDIGAQLFCAMLRSAGVDTRLVCSLQPLPFQPSQKVGIHQVKPRRHIAHDLDHHAEGDKFSNGSALPGTPEGQGRRSASPAFEPLQLRKQRKLIRESKYPVYWVEVFNEAVQKWVPVDPLVTKTIAKPSKFEPPAGEPQNNMSYVLAFEDDGSARDVTKRYVKAYNAKTRRERVEVTNGGERWWRSVMKMYTRSHHMDRDQVEDAELATKEAAEPMPRNVQDFKDHPYYALERHLKRHEVIHPKREVGKVGAGRTGGTSSLEPIYRRRDVHMVKSADKWYRLGREIKSGEQPLKRIPIRRHRQQSTDPDDINTLDGDAAGTAMYAAYQTLIYSAPPVVNGRIPKNVYGNLDLYVPSMVPPGGSHILHPETAKAARIVGVDYADAVTGFAFKGRHGTAIVNGAVVTIEHKEAIEEVIRTFEDDRARAEEDRRSLEALRMWKRLLAGLRIRQRIQSYEAEGGQDPAVKKEIGKVDVRSDDEDDEGGGFFPDQGSEEAPKPTVGRLFEQPGLPCVEDDEGGGFMVEESETDVDDQRRLEQPRLGNDVVDNSPDDSGGFLINEIDADAEEALREAEFCEDQGIETTNLDANHGTDTQNNRSELTIDARTAEQISREESEGTEGTSDQLIANENDDHLATEPLHKLTSQTTTTQSNRDSSDQDVEITNTQTNAKLSNTISPSTTHSELETPGKSEQPCNITRNTTTSTPVPQTPAHDHDDVDQQTAALQTTQTIEETIKSASPESDKGSLLSHDPDDEDAEPDWLD